MGTVVANYFAQQIPDPEPLDLGGASRIAGRVTGIQLLDSRTSENPDQNYLSYYLEYSNAHKSEASITFASRDLPDPIRDLIAQLHRKTNTAVMEWFWSIFGQGEVNPEKWQARKLEIFISHRPSGTVLAQQIFHALGGYAQSGVFLPRIDSVDMQAGNWLDQLMQMIDRSRVFIPVLTADYLQGPIARPELDQALRQTLTQGDRRIVPVLAEGSPAQYQDHFIGGFHMILAQEGLSTELLEQLAYMCLGVSRNPYE